MHSGAASSKRVVVHAGQIIMHQAIGMDQFHRRRRAQTLRHLHIEYFAAGDDQKRAQALAAAQDRIAHGIEQAMLQLPARGQQIFQFLVHGLGGLGQHGVEINHSYEPLGSGGGELLNVGGFDRLGLTGIVGNNFFDLLAGGIQLGFAMALQHRTPAV